MSLSWPAMRTRSLKTTQLLPRLAHFLFLSAVKSVRRFHSPGVKSVSQVSFPFLNTHLFGSPRHQRVFEMPRRRGIPRRGSSSAPRGRASLSPSPNVIPISSASPSSRPPNPSSQTPNTSFQTSRFTFRSRLNRPVVTITTTILMAEEAEQQNDPAISSSTQSPEESLAQGELEGATLIAEHMQEDSPAAEDTTRQRTPTQEDVLVCGPVQHDFGVLSRTLTLRPRMINCLLHAVWFLQLEGLSFEFSYCLFYLIWLCCKFLLVHIPTLSRLFFFWNSGGCYHIFGNSVVRIFATKS